MLAPRPADQVVAVTNPTLATLIAKPVTLKTSELFLKGGQGLRQQATKAPSIADMSQTARQGDGSGTECCSFSQGLIPYQPAVTKIIPILAACAN